MPCSYPSGMRACETAKDMPAELAGMSDLRQQLTVLAGPTRRQKQRGKVAVTRTRESAVPLLIFWRYNRSWIGKTVGIAVSSPGFAGSRRAQVDEVRSLLSGSRWLSRDFRTRGQHGQGVGETAQVAEHHNAVSNLADEGRVAVAGQDPDASALACITSTQQAPGRNTNTAWRVVDNVPRSELLGDVAVR
jgi:hypothetical protein